MLVAGRGQSPTRVRARLLQAWPPRDDGAPPGYHQPMPMRRHLVTTAAEIRPLDQQAQTGGARSSRTMLPASLSMALRRATSSRKTRIFIPGQSRGVHCPGFAKQGGGGELPP